MSVVVHLDPSVVAREIDGEVLVLDRRGNRLHQFNRTASFVWRRCGEGLSMEQIVEALVRDFDVSEEAARRDLQDFLRLLGDMDLIG